MEQRVIRHSQPTTINIRGDITTRLKNTNKTLRQRRTMTKQLEHLNYRRNLILVSQKILIKHNFTSI